MESAVCDLRIAGFRFWLKRRILRYTAFWTRKQKRRIWHYTAFWGSCSIVIPKSKTPYYPLYGVLQKSIIQKRRILRYTAFTKTTGKTP